MNISATEFNNRLSEKETLHIIDVREELEFHTFNVGGSNIPLGKLMTTEELDFNEHDELLVICQRGIRSKTACKILEGMGFKNVRNVEGGLIGLQRIKNKKNVCN